MASRKEEMHMTTVAQADQLAAAVLTPLLDGPRSNRVRVVAASLLEAIAHDTLGNPEAAERALRHALELAEPDQVLSPFLSHPARHRQALTHSETRVLHYLSTNLSTREIADELYLSVNTVKTHQRHLYQKLGARSRTQAVEQARALGLIASASTRISASFAASLGASSVSQPDTRTMNK
jgi:LuxR family maltose regulon positive regulatory protein